MVQNREMTPPDLGAAEHPSDYSAEAREPEARAEAGRPIRRLWPLPGTGSAGWS